MRRLIALALLLAVEGKNLVINGDFEHNKIGEVGVRKSPPNKLPGWTVEAGTVAQVQGLWTPSTKQKDDNSLDINGGAGVSQVVTTEPGQLYVLSFAIGGNYHAATDEPSHRQMNVSFGGKSLGIVTHSLPGTSQPYSSTGPYRTFNWSSYTFNVTGSGSDKLLFHGLSPGSQWAKHGITLDNVQLMRIVPTVAPLLPTPTPPTSALPTQAPPTPTPTPVPSTAAPTTPPTPVPSTSAPTQAPPTPVPPTPTSPTPVPSTSAPPTPLPVSEALTTPMPATGAPTAAPSTAETATKQNSGLGSGRGLNNTGSDELAAAADSTGDNEGGHLWMWLSVGLLIGACFFLGLLLYCRHAVQGKGEEGDRVQMELAGPVALVPTPSYSSVQMSEPLNESLLSRELQQPDDTLLLPLAPYDIQLGSSPRGRSRRSQAYIGPITYPLGPRGYPY